MEEYVKKEEFAALEKEVELIKKEMLENGKLLQAIDKKIDLISAKIVSEEEISDLKLKPVEKRVTDLEESQKWLIRAILLEIIGIVSAFIFK